MDLRTHVFLPLVHLMATSILTYRGGFAVVGEVPLICAVALIWAEATSHANDPLATSFYHEQLQRWRSHVKNSGIGCVQFDLEALLGRDTVRESDLARCVTLAEAKVQSFGAIVPGSYLDPILQMNEIRGDFPSDPLLNVLRKLRIMLGHELFTQY